MGTDGAMSSINGGQSTLENGLMDEKRFLQRIGIRRAYLHILKRKGLISYLKAGRRTFYDEQSYKDYLNNCTKRVTGLIGSSAPVGSRPVRRRVRSGSRRRNK
jgi:hypothetical protein